MYDDKHRMRIYIDVVLVGLGAVAYAALVRHLYMSGLDGASAGQAFGVRSILLLALVLMSLAWFLARAFTARAQEIKRRVW